MPKKKIAIIGAGSVGLESAVYGVCLGHDVRVFERGRTGENMRQWGHTRLFSPWSLNHSSLGARMLREAGVPLPGDGDYLTGSEHLSTYLEPLARSAPLAGRIHEETRVIRVGRDRTGKRIRPAAARRSHPFVLLLEGPEGERYETADVVLDCSGCYGHHNWMGSGNLPALGERRLADRIAYTLRDIGGAEREAYQGRAVLLVGTGLSAATALDSLIHLPDTTVHWVSQGATSSPLAVVVDDPLPERDRVARLANELAHGVDRRVTFHRETIVERIEEAAGTFRVTLRNPTARIPLVVDHILAHVGYSPDNSLYRDLQVHECYASSGPMGLAAALPDDDSGDCLAQTSKGPELLKNPEPDFYILGAKSYGKNSSFLIRIGLDQVRDVFTLIEGRPELDLYADARDAAPHAGDEPCLTPKHPSDP